MTWVAAEPAGSELAGFGKGARVEYDLTDGTTVRGKIVVPGTDKVGSAHGIELDTDVQPCELHWIGTGLVRPEGEPAASAPKAPHPLTPAMQRAMDQLTGTLRGQVRKGEGIRTQTARALHRRGAAFLIEPYYDNGDWLLVIVEPEEQRLTDEDLLELDPEEAAVLAELDAVRRYRALRHAHIVSRHFAERDVAAGYPQLARTRLEALRERVRVVAAWRRMEISDREYGKYTDHAGQQWKWARTQATNLWNIGTGYGEGLLVVEATTTEEAEAKATAAIKADPVGYRELLESFGRRRLTVQEAVDARRVREAAQGS